MMRTYHSQRTSLVSALLLSGLLILLSACSSPFSGTSSNAQGNTSKGDGKPATSQTASATSQPTPQTSCPAAGTSRAAIMPAMSLGKDQSIVYIANAVGGTSASLKRVDVQTKVITTILSQPTKTIESAQISSDGQWILFSELLNTNAATIQLVRMDGQYFQTLYCTQTDQQYPAINMQWSPDQKMIIFDQTSQSNQQGSLYLLQLANGNIQMEMSFSAQDQTISLATWVDNTRVYVTSGFVMGGGIIDLYLLDTGKGYNQHFSDLQLIKSDPQGFGFDNSYDGSKLFILSDDSSSSGVNTIKIEAMALNGSNGHTVFSGFQNKGLLFPILTVGYSSESVVFILDGGNGTTGTENNGLWKINVDGTGLTNVAKDEAGPWNKYNRYPWSNFSRDGLFYSTDGFYGSFSRGPLGQYTNDLNELVGWTSM